MNSRIANSALTFLKLCLHHRVGAFKYRRALKRSQSKYFFFLILDAYGSADIKCDVNGAFNEILFVR